MKKGTEIRINDIVRAAASDVVRCWCNARDKGCEIPVIFLLDMEDENAKGIYEDTPLSPEDEEKMAAPFPVPEGAIPLVYMGFDHLTAKQILDSCKEGLYERTIERDLHLKGKIHFVVVTAGVVCPGLAEAFMIPVEAVLDPQRN